MKTKLLKIINHWGVDHQQRKLEEEVFEFQKEITIAEGVGKIGITSDIGETCKKHLEEEVGDVLNVLYQFIVYYDLDIDNIINSRIDKIYRTIGDIENEIHN